jgi:hypothetical protein
MVAFRKNFGHVVWRFCFGLAAPLIGRMVHCSSRNQIALTEKIDFFKEKGYFIISKQNTREQAKNIQ